MIQALDRESVHKICSGQVVVDLATAVKEMVENALDAGASHIDIKLKDMGADMIEVADNGGGIDPANHSGIALKHCTSKLESFGDLNSITSFGFRGEALNALCELSESMTISTMQIDQAVGTLLSFEQDGTLKDKSVVARTPGTTVSVRKLFSRLPVRRSEFVRTIKKHFQKMVKIVQTYAVISVGVKIMISNVNSNGSRQTVLSTPSSTKLIDNISNIFGAKFATSLIPVTIEVDVSAADDRENIKESSYPKVDHNQPASGVEPEQNEDDLPQQRDKENNFYSDGAALDTTRKTNRVVKISGFVSKVGEGVGRSDNDRQFVFCNGRPVDMPRISRAMNEVWRRYEMKQKPAFILCFRIPDGLFDVNLTPDKREVLVCQERTIVEHLRDYVDRIYAPVRSQMPLNQGMPAAVSAATSTCVSGFTGGMVTTSSSCASYQSSEGIETDQQRNATITGLKRKATEDTVTLDRFLTSYSTATNDAAPEDPGLSKEHMTEDPLSPSSSLSLPSSPGNRLRGDNTAVRADAYEAVANEIGKRSADEGSGAAGEKATTPLKAVLWMSPVERERLQDSQTKKQQRVLALTEVLEATKSRPETASQVAMAVQSENEGWDGHTTDIVHPLPPAGNEQQQQPPALEPRTHSWSFDPLAVLQCLQKRRRVNDASLASTAGLGSVSSSEDTSAADATSSNDGETGTGTGTGTGNGTGTGSGTSPANGSLSDINSVAGDEAIDSTDGAAVDMRSAGGAATPSDRRVLTKDVRSIRLLGYAYGRGGLLI